MGTVDVMAAILAVWTALTVVLVWAWSVHTHRHQMSFVIREPRSHVRVIDGVALAPVISLDSRRR